jgi:hypothetical protein
MSDKDKFVLLLLLFSTVFISGCIFDKGKGTINSDFIPQTNLPSGYTYLGIHETSVGIGNSSLSAVEGVYKYNGDDLYIQTINNDNPDALIAQYKLKYKDANYNPFENVTVNGHTALKVTDYPTVNGQQKPKYTVMWSKGKFLIIVGSSTDSYTVMALATVTGG